ncbi:unnamed protein product [Prorocentrum cordatum]|uniref:Uncharacterized protein n=1 Tax=Prorocentrum cordatum TaxID=2364126 RepID=A0ABN9TEL3_9DINO|nr:unnamed protein product [Polarella glacialis]
MPEVLNVEGVGNGRQQCTEFGRVPIALPAQEHETEGTPAVYTAPVVPNSNIPALLGLRPFRQLRTVFDIVNNKNHFLGPGDATFQLPPGTRPCDLEGAPSGHLMLPVSEFQQLGSNRSGNGASPTSVTTLNLYHHNSHGVTEAASVAKRPGDDDVRTTSTGQPTVEPPLARSDTCDVGDEALRHAGQSKDLPNTLDIGLLVVRSLVFSIFATDTSVSQVISWQARGLLILSRYLSAWSTELGSWTISTLSVNKLCMNVDADTAVKFKPDLAWIALTGAPTSSINNRERLRACTVAQIVMEAVDLKVNLIPCHTDMSEMHEARCDMVKALTEFVWQQIITADSASGGETILNATKSDGHMEMLPESNPLAKSETLTLMSSKTVSFNDSVEIYPTEARIRQKAKEKHINIQNAASGRPQKTKQRNMKGYEKVWSDCGDDMSSIDLEITQSKVVNEMEMQTTKVKMEHHLSQDKMQLSRSYLHLHLLELILQADHWQLIDAIGPQLG